MIINTRRISELLIELNELSQNYRASKAKRENIGLNVFIMTSDLYYRENFHSDILKAFLDPTGAHQEGNKYLDIFVQMLGLNPKDYQSALVEREPHRIDILITHKQNKKCIIIENKINDAVDQERQLPRYYDALIKDGYEHDNITIVYMPFKDDKFVNPETWSKDEIVKIKEHLKTIPFISSQGSENVLDNWVTPSIQAAKNPDSLSILSQYGKLLQHLNTAAIDMKILNEFYEELKKQNSYEAACTIRDMLAELPACLAQRIKARFEEKQTFEPFTKVYIFHDTTTVFQGATLNGNGQLEISIWCEPNGYRVIFGDRSDEKINIEDIASKLAPLGDYQYEDEDGNAVEKSSIRKDFKTMDEEHVVAFIEKICATLKNKN